MSELTNNHVAHEVVKEYYGKELTTQQDLKTSACCSTESIPLAHRQILKEIAPEILDKFYGCGSPVPDALEGRTVLDLGCGSGRDVYLVSKLVGPEGFVIGVDMTDEQLAVAEKYKYSQSEVFGYDHPNVEFRKGYIEDLAAAGLEDNSVDVVISNCVINLSPNKEQVFAEIFRVLKPGGELYFSDVFSDRRIPQHLIDDPVLYGECLSGALYIEDFRRMLQKVGMPDYRIISQSQIALEDPALEAKAGMINFYSLTVRAFKLASLEDICEDYGQVAVYNGGIPDAPHQFTLDDHHIFQLGKPMLVCGNTAAMLEETRFSNYFTISGNRNTHYGAFDCGDAPTLSAGETSTLGACC